MGGQLLYRKQPSMLLLWAEIVEGLTHLTRMMVNLGY